MKSTNKFKKIFKGAGYSVGHLSLGAPEDVLQGMLDGMHVVYRRFIHRHDSGKLVQAFNEGMNEKKQAQESK